ncbi:MAG TPA: hypothetical protein VGR67_09450 [Candidatus Polarisedimenticolia bacterium]|jgi:hypothetical protein|nr:hypothetical protein [Candidatus Polarisedimenticolia bacterium]
MNWKASLCAGIAAACLTVLGTASPAKQAAPMEKFDLASLANGETRTFGEGDHAITATRQGAEVVVTYGDDGGRKTLHCQVGKDSCYAMTLSDEGKAHVVVLDKKSGPDKDLTRIVLADGDADENVVTVSGDGDEEPGIHVIRIHDDEGKILRCPEGDATLTLKDGEEDKGQYLCPRHSLRMELSKEPILIKKIRVDKKSKDKDADE